jgi:hypothetical protein
VRLAWNSPLVTRSFVDRVRAGQFGATFLPSFKTNLSPLDRRWLFGAVVLLANWPYTMFIIMPTNRHLMDAPPEAASSETRRMLERWGALHAGRSALGVVATLIFLWAQR